MNKSTMARKPKRVGPYKYFVPMSIGGVICNAMVDSGNLWKNVLSLDFLHQLGLTRDDLREVPGIQEVGTAKSGTGLKVLGELKTPIQLRFGGCATRFKCRPVVLEGLSMPFNLSGPFLAQFGIDQLNSEGALLVQGNKIPMVASLNLSADVEQTVSNLYVMEKVTVPAFSKTKFAVRASAVEGGTMSPGDGIVTGSVHFSDRHDLHPFLNVVTKCDKDGQVRVGVMNTTMDPVVIPVGTKYGSFSRIVDASNHAEHPFRIAIINNVAKDTAELKKTTAKKKTAQETKSADPTEPELAPWLVGPTTAANREARFAHLISVFKLKDSPLLDTTDKVAQASCMLLKRWACFSFDGNYGRTTLLKHSIVTEPDQLPINQRFRPVNPHLEGDLKKQIDKWLKHGVIE
jgi:hypothetical protein